MSLKLAGMVFEFDLPHNKAWVLMSLLGHADDDGSKIFPSIERTAWKTGYSQRQVQRIIAALIDDGILELVQEATQHRPNEYHAHIDRIPRKAPFRDDKMSPLATQGRQNVTPTKAPGVTFCQSRGDILSGRGDILSPDSCHDSFRDSDPTPPIPPTAPEGAPPAAAGGGGASVRDPEPVDPPPISLSETNLNLLRAAGVRVPAALAKAAKLPTDAIRRVIRAAKERPPEKRAGWIASQCIALATMPPADRAAALADLAPPSRRDDPPPLPERPPMTAEERRAFLARSPYQPRTG